MPSKQASGGYSPEFLSENFDDLRNAAIEDLTRYVSGWSVYSVKFLNSVAELQGIDARLDPEIIPELRRLSKRVEVPHLRKLIRQATDADSMEVEKIIEIISAQASPHMSKQA